MTRRPNSEYLTGPSSPQRKGPRQNGDTWQKSAGPWPGVPMLILALVLVVVTLGFGVVIPIMPFYIEHFGAGGTELGVLVSVYAIMRLVCGPIWGSLSDRFGRKPVLLIGISGYAITMVWFGLATSLWMLFAARILAGVLSSATSPTTMAYIGDSTPENERGRGMGILGAAAGLGTVLGPALGGLLGQTSLATPFFIAAGMSVLALILAALFLPESLPAGQRRPARERKLIDLRTWGRAIWSPIGAWLVLTALSTGGLMIFYGTFGLYALEKYGFGPDKVGLVFMVVGLATAVAQGALAGPLTKRWGETRVIQASMLATVAAFILLVVAGNLLAVLLAVAFFSLTTALQMPALMAITSRRATVEQGVAMGLSNSFISLGRIVGPTVGGILLDVHSESPYLIGAALMLVGFLASTLRSPPSARTARPNAR